MTDQRLQEIEDSLPNEKLEWGYRARFMELITEIRRQKKLIEDMGRIQTTKPEEAWRIQH